ncbi:MAG: hypothetical protein ACREN8_11455, partial [Candidatus Dormibacteraceae bacterium]
VQEGRLFEGVGVRWKDLLQRYRIHVRILSNSTWECQPLLNNTSRLAVDWNSLELARLTSGGDPGTSPIYRNSPTGSPVIRRSSLVASARWSWPTWPPPI